MGGDHKKRAKYRFASKTLIRILPSPQKELINDLIDKKEISMDLYDILGKCTWREGGEPEPEIPKPEEANEVKRLKLKRRRKKQNQRRQRHNQFKIHPKKENMKGKERNHIRSPVSGLFKISQNKMEL